MNIFTNNQLRRLLEKTLFFGYYPRINCIKSIGLISFCFGLIFILMYLPKAFNYQRTDFELVVQIIVWINILIIMAQRLNDFDFSSWWLLLFLLINPLLPLVICVIPGTKGINRYGNQPPNASLYDYLNILFGPLVLMLLIYVRPL
jgi:hypothetical protein